MVQKMKKSKGFTLIEMLVVIAIIAVLVSIIIPVVGNSTAKARAAADAANLRSVASTAMIEYLETSTAEGSTITGTNLPDITPKSTDLSGAHVEIWLQDNSVEAYYVKSSSYYGVGELAAAAEGGKLTAATSAPAEEASDGTATGNYKIYTTEKTN